MLAVSSVKILLVEDNLAEARLLEEIFKLSNFQFSLVHVQRLRDALERLHPERFDVILLDLTLPDSYGLASLVTLIHHVPSTPIVVLTNTNDEQLAVEAVRQGAQDYLVKRQVNVDLLVRSLRYAIERQQVAETLRNANELLETQMQERTTELVKAKELNQTKAEFVSMLSHDCRNPLTAILLSMGLLEGSDHLLTPEKKLSHFQKIRTAINNMAKLLDEALVIGRADSGNLHFSPHPLDLEEFCYHLVEELQLSTLQNPQVRLITQGRLNEGIWDENLLRHIFINLLANAIKYSPLGGVIRFEIKREGETVRFQIQDSGIGIPPAELQQLFEPFHRASNVGSIPGTGLGLAIVKRCVEAHQGQIQVESNEQGTKFIIVLPLQYT